jgi:hypothetical protein
MRHVGDSSAGPVHAATIGATNPGNGGSPRPKTRRQPQADRLAGQEPLSDPEEFESKTLRVEKVIAGNSEATTRLRALDAGRYPFFVEFNEATAQGVLVTE